MIGGAIELYTIKEEATSRSDYLGTFDLIRQNLQLAPIMYTK